MELVLAIIAVAVIAPVGTAALVLRLSARAIGRVFGAGCLVALLLLLLAQCLVFG